MTKVCIFHDGVKEKKFQASQFPLTIGSSNVDIVLPSVSPEAGVVYVDYADQQPFIQAETRSQVFLNEKLLFESSWLNDGDTIRMESATVSCKINQGQITFQLLPPSADKSRILTPPDQQEKSLSPPVEPKIEHSPPESTETASQKQTKYTLSPGKSALFVAFVVLLMLTAFVFLATPVTFKVNPEPDDLDVEGGLFSFKMVGHYLIWPGEYHVIAEKKGYIPLHETVHINRGNSVTFAYQLEKLGGILTLSSEPVSGADVYIDEQLAGQTPLVDKQVSPGQHTIGFKYPRYQNYKKDIEVDGEGKRQSIVARLVPDWAVVGIQSQPSDTIVIVDGKEQGNTPVKLELLTGKHSIELAKKGYQSWIEEISVAAGKNQQLPLITLEKTPGILLLSTRPVGVNVLVDKKFQGKTPLKLKLKPGLKHEIKLYKAGYAQMLKNVEVASGNEKNLELQLVANYGAIKLLNVPAGATLYVDGKQQKNLVGELRLTTRNHQLEIRKAGFQPFKTIVTPRSGLPAQIQVKLKPIVPVASLVKSLQTAEQAALAYVKPGRFMMGASRREQGRRSNELLHEVELTRGFYVGKKEVSNAEYRKFKPDHYSGNAQGLSLDNDQNPVVNISWDDAARYCNWLSKQHGLQPVYIEKKGAMMAARPLSNGYRLPTEAEWVLAARYFGLGSPLKYPWGQSFPIVTNSGNYASGDNFTVSAPIATFPANKRGLYDTGGNVSEWVNDYYSVFIDAGKAPVKDPLGPVIGKHHVVRGSSWRQDSMSELRLSYRDYAQDKRSDLGFRVARYAH